MQNASDGPLIARLFHALETYNSANERGDLDTEELESSLFEIISSGVDQGGDDFLEVCVYTISVLGESKGCSMLARLYDEIPTHHSLIERIAELAGLSERICLARKGVTEMPSAQPSTQST